MRNFPDQGVHRLNHFLTPEKKTEPEKGAETLETTNRLVQMILSFDTNPDEKWAKWLIARLGLDARRADMLVRSRVKLQREMDRFIAKGVNMLLLNLSKDYPNQNGSQMIQDWNEMFKDKLRDFIASRIMVLNSKLERDFSTPSEKSLPE